MATAKRAQVLVLITEERVRMLMEVGDLQTVRICDAWLHGESTVDAHSGLAECLDVEAAISEALAQAEF